MTHRIRRVAVLASLASLAAVPALAADPVPGARYVGQTSQGNDPRFEFRVSDDGSRVQRAFAQFRARRCERARNGTQGSIRVRSIAIEDGAFFKRGKETARLRPSGLVRGRHADRALPDPGPLPDLGAGAGDAQGHGRGPQQGRRDDRHVQDGQAQGDVVGRPPRRRPRRGVPDPGGVSPCSLAGEPAPRGA